MYTEKLANGKQSICLGNVKNHFHGEEKCIPAQHVKNPLQNVDVRDILLSTIKRRLHDHNLRGSTIRWKPPVAVYKKQKKNTGRILGPGAMN